MFYLKTKVMKMLIRSIAVIISCLLIATGANALSDKNCLRSDEVGEAYLTFAGKY